MIACCGVGHGKPHHDLVHYLRAAACDISGLPIGTGSKHQLVFCRRIDQIFGDVLNQTTAVVHCGVKQRLAGVQITQADGNAARMGAVNAV